MKEEAIWQRIGEEVEDRKEGKAEEIGEQQALYTRAKRRGNVLPDRVVLNPERQHTGNDFTGSIDRISRKFDTRIQYAAEMKILSLLSNLSIVVGCRMDLLCFAS